MNVLSRRLDPAALLTVLLLGVLLLTTSLPARAAAGEEPQEAQEPQEGFLVHPPDIDAGVAARLESQHANRVTLAAFHDFRFTDEWRRSQLYFLHRPPDKDARARRGLAWDGASSVAAADVDGDGHIDLYFVTPGGDNHLRRNRGDGTFEDVTRRAHLGFEGYVTVAAAFADLDDDTDPDLVVSTTSGPVLMMNTGNGSFIPRNKRAGLPETPGAPGVSGVVIFDAEPDGRLDLLLLPAEPADPVRLYLQDKKLHFVLSEIPAGPHRKHGPPRDAGAADVDEDGDPDLYMLDARGRGFFYENTGRGTFVAKTSPKPFPETPATLTGVQFFDVDNDGRVELFLSGRATSVWSRPGDAWRAADVPGQAWGASVGDLNADGFADLVVPAGRGYPFAFAGNTILLNESGARLAAVEYLLRVEPRHGGQVQPWLQLDCSGADEGHEHCAGRQGTLFVHGARSSRCAVLFDADGDGDLDLVVSDVNAEAQVLINDLAERREIRYLEVSLVGTTSNRDGLGAVVTVRTDTGPRTAFHDGRSGHLTYSSLPLYFGLTGSREILGVEVRWPSGVRQAVAPPIAFNTLLEVEEPEVEK